MTLDVAVVGGGLCGLSIARTLFAAGRDVGVFEARARLGGRIAAETSPSGQRIDLGATWFWPRSQPLMSRLVRSFGLCDSAQHDAQSVLVQDHPSEPARQVKLGPVHGGARRLEGSMLTLIEAVAAALPEERVQLDHELVAVERRGSRIALHFLVSGTPKIVLAQRVVLALPPRLIAEHVRFEPALDEALRSSLQETPTWMATQAKVALSYAEAQWRSTGSSGNAFVLHHEAVLKEAFDACEDDTRLATLAAFVALPPEARAELAALTELVAAQVASLFGMTQPRIGAVACDWAKERYTCSTRDRNEYSLLPPHTDYDRPELRKPRWDKRLFFAGTETAELEGGYMEGALHAAERVTQQLAQLPRLARALPSPHSCASVLAASAQDDRLTHFQTWLHEQREPSLEDYKKRVVSLLPSPERGHLTQRALLASVQQLFSAALEQLQTGPTAVHSRRDAALAPRVHEAVHAFLSALILDVLGFNRSAPELAACTGEQQPSRSYMLVMLREIYAAHRRFSREVTAILVLHKTRADLPVSDQLIDPVVA